MVLHITFKGGHKPIRFHTLGEILESTRMDILIVSLVVLDVILVVTQLVISSQYPHEVTMHKVES